MANRHPHHFSRKQKQRMAVIGAAAIGVAAVGLLIYLLLQMMRTPRSVPEESSAVSQPPTSSTTQTVTVPSSTTTTTTTTTTPPSTVSNVSAENSRQLLQYDTTGHYVQPAGAPWQLLLVNDWNPLPAAYDSGVTMVAVGNNQRVDSRIQADLQAMLEAGKAYGIGVQSGYRPASQQSTLYWRQVDRFLAQGYSDTAAQTAAGKIVKRPGYSEHNCGLAVDLGGSGNFRLEEDFADTPAYAWLTEHCAEYGFILRYPKSKESVTGVVYEPWHYRYVGKEAAAVIMSRGLCLEEYLEENSASF